MSKLTILQTYGQRAVEGEVGIEIEAEGTNLPDLNQSKWSRHEDKLIEEPKSEYWVAKTDPSLRGDGAKEFIYSKPLNRELVLPSLIELDTKIKENKGKIIPSDRAGVHVHMNVQPFTYEECLTFICLYLVFEPALLRYCGDERNGNMFCLGAEHSEYLIERLADSRKYNTFKKSVISYTMRYASCNLEALSKYGSIEFRSMRTDADFVAPVNTWVNVLLKIKDKSRTFNKVEGIVEQFSDRGCEGFAAHVLEELMDTFWYDDAERDVLAAVRRVQDVAYAPQIGAFKPVDTVKVWVLRNEDGTLNRPMMDDFAHVDDQYNAYYRALRQWEVAVVQQQDEARRRVQEAQVVRDEAAGINWQEVVFAPRDQQPRDDFGRFRARAPRHQGE